MPGTPGFVHQLGGLEKQGEQGQVSYDADNHEAKVKERAQKIEGIATRYQPLQVEGAVSAPTLVIGWGSTAGSIKMAYEACLSRGVSFAFMHLRHLHPLPLTLESLLKQYQQILVVELNTGHLWQRLRARYLVDARLISHAWAAFFSETANECDCRGDSTWALIKEKICKCHGYSLVSWVWGYAI